MVSERSRKTYTNYVLAYEKWCASQNLPPDSSLAGYREWLTRKRCSASYVKNVINAIGHLQHVVVAPEAAAGRSGAKFAADELVLLRRLCRNRYREEELSLILLLLLDSSLTLRKILRLTFGDARVVVETRRTGAGDAVSAESLYLFEYLLSTSFYGDPTLKFFNKTYHAYYHAFKELQRHLFPGAPSRSFKALK